MKFKCIVLLILCIAVVAAAGCMGLPASVPDRSATQETIYMGDSSDYWGSASKVANSNNVAVPAPVAAGTPSMEGSGTGDIDTKIIKTAYLTIEVKDVTTSVESLKAMAAGKGGYLTSTSIQKNYNNHLTGNVVMRIPQADFENTIAGVKALGTVKSASTRGEDVTEEYVDILAQKTSYQNQLAQYNTIMKQSTKVEDIIKVQEQIDRVQTELDRLEGRLKYLNSRIDLSTITVNLQEPEPVGGETGHNFVSTFNEGIAGFFGMIDAIIILFFTLIPLFILGGIGYFTYRRYKGKKSADVLPEEKK
ncbi:MAG: DUF4349 domain-containing protein [Methanoregula sp.]|jgi:hypothetical protein|nr:DUF4349 domain-containing protein [Methanoregula sp.]